MKLRQLVRVLHRDTGYFCVGLTVFYAVSGIAVNHIDDWNPSYSRSEEHVALGPLSGDLESMEQAVVAGAGIDADDVRGRHRPDPGTFVVFLPNGGEAKVAVATGEGKVVRITTRPFLFESNVLHLNHLKGVWTYVADGFSVLLILLAITGMFILKGRQGLGGRGKWFVSAGIMLPVAFLVYYYATRAA
ncbi:MAG: PepSY-associated TM helix domain-containing protein [Planctomycetota bacterium]